MEFKSGDKIRIKLDCTKYKNQIKPNSTGIIQTIYDNKYNKYNNGNIAVKIDGHTNASSEKGLFYFKKEDIESCERTVEMYNIFDGGWWGNIDWQNKEELFKTHYLCDWGEEKTKSTIDVEELKKALEITKKEGENNKMKTEKIVELWYNKTLEKTRAKNRETNENLFNSDKNLITINEKFKEAEDLIKKTMIENKIDGIYDGKEVFSKVIYAHNLLVTKETTKSLEELSIKAEKDIKEIEDKYTEIKAILSACETCEQEFDILKAYGIIENGRLSV